MVICLEQGADLHVAQLMPLPLTDSCFSKIQIGFTFLVPAHPGSPGQRAVKRVLLLLLLVVRLFALRTVFTRAVIVLFRHSNMITTLIFHVEVHCCMEDIVVYFIMTLLPICC